MGKFKVIPIEVFNTDVLVSINQSNIELYAQVFKDLGFTKKEFDSYWNDWTSDARTVTHPKGFVMIRFRDEINYNHDSVGLVSHEAYHAAYSVLSRISIQPGYETEEVYAHLIQFIVREIFKN